ncbi:polysaccharide deacetylase family protein [Sporolactobacillus pectinivorans]|uniref:polysaccharide deacetylase family protein n=1 Tax=Sporolactobacillus pectinivorans TaxID=1591408 RepID=UPI001EFE7A2E|nr:polysaccharide deacetylase family protein [Sporolactobacillus pectinivorans]
MCRFRRAAPIFLALTIVLFQCIFGKAAIAMIDRFDYEPRGSVVWDVRNHQKSVALTFDDGPHPVYTPQVLDVLKKYHAKATFFLIGKRMQAYPDLVKREVAEGHELGNHTFSHVSLHGKSNAFFLNEVSKTDDLINQYQGPPRIRLLRPPGGDINAQTVLISEKNHFEIILWSWNQDPKDWSKPGVSRIVRHVLTNIKSGDIILLHDSGGNRKQTVAALKIIIPTLQSRGYKFVTLYDLLKNDKKYDDLYNFGLDQILNK